MMQQKQIKLVFSISGDTKKSVKLKSIMPIRAIVQKVKMIVEYSPNIFHGLYNEVQQD